MLSKKELYNAKNAGRKVENGLEIKVTNVGTFADKDKDGNDVTVTALKSESGEVYTTISGNIAAGIELLDEIITTDGPVTVKVVESTSNAGRSFFQLEIVD